MIGAAAVDIDVDAEPGLDLARLDVVAADRELSVDLRRRERKHVGGGGGRRGPRLVDVRCLGEAAAGRRQEGQCERGIRYATRHRHRVLRDSLYHEAGAAARPIRQTVKGRRLQPEASAERVRSCGSCALNAHARGGRTSAKVHKVHGPTRAGVKAACPGLP